LWSWVGNIMWPFVLVDWLQARPTRALGTPERGAVLRCWILAFSFPVLTRLVEAAGCADFREFEIHRDAQRFSAPEWRSEDWQDVRGHGLSGSGPSWL